MSDNMSQKQIDNWMKMNAVYGYNGITASTESIKASYENRKKLIIEAKRHGNADTIRNMENKLSERMNKDEA